MTTVEESVYARSFERNIGILTGAEQQALRTSTVAVAGLGGIGGNVVMTLARMGVGRFRIADFDTFELANINRQYGATVDTVGQRKCDVIAAELRRVNPDVTVDVFPDGFTDATGNALLRDADLAIDAVDFYAIDTHLAFHRKTREHGLFTLMGSPVGFSACLQVFDPAGMSIEEYCGIHLDMDPLEKQLRYACGLVPELAHIDYYDVSTSESNTDFSAGVGPSLACAASLAAALVASEATIILLNRRRTRAIPHTIQFDPYTYRYERPFIPGGMRHYDPAPALRRLADRSSLVPQVLDFLYGKPKTPRVDINHAKLFHRQEGKGHPLVLVAPLGADSSFWARQLDDLTAAARVVTFDARGSGISTPCPDGCSVELLADDLIALLEHIDLTRTDLAGVALGGLVAVEVAARRPDLVRSLVLVSTYTAADDHIRQTTARWRELARTRGMEELFKHCAQWVFSPDYVRDNRTELDKLRTFFRLTTQDPESFCQQSLAGVSYDARPALRRVSCPALVVHGGADRLVHPRHAEELAAALPASRLSLIDAAPHFLTWENEKRFNEETLNFLAEIGQGSR